MQRQDLAHEIIIEIDKKNDVSTLENSPRFIRWHGLFESESATKEQKTPFISNVTEVKQTDDYNTLNSKLLEFLEHKIIAKRVVADVIFYDKTPTSEIRFPSIQELNQIRTTLGNDKKKCFEALLEHARLPLVLFLRTQAESTLENLLYKAMKNLMDKSLKGKLSSEAQTLIDEVQTRLPKQMSMDIINGKTDPVIKVIKAGAPVAPLLLRDYLYGVAYKSVLAEPKLVELLIEKKCAINFAKGVTPLMLLFSCAYYDNAHDRIKQITELLLANGADVDLKHDGKTAYQLASKNDFPSDILKLVRPPSARFCWFS